MTPPESSATPGLAQMRAEFEEWVRDRGCDTDGAWSAWQAAWNRRPSPAAPAAEDGSSDVPLEWYTRLATMALEAIEAGQNAPILMNVEGIKEHLRAAQQGKWPEWYAHRDARHAAAELVCAAGSLQGKISDEPDCAKWPDQRNRGLLQAAKQAEAALKKYMLSNEPSNWNLLYEAQSYLRPAIKREEDFRAVLCAAGAPAGAAQSDTENGQPQCPFCGERHRHCDSPGAIVTGTTGCDKIDGPARERLAALRPSAMSHPSRAAEGREINKDPK